MMGRLAASLLLGSLLFAATRSARAQLSLYTVADLALRNSKEVHMGEADVTRAASDLAQTRDAYLPNLVVGSGLGYSYGFPVGQPSIFNVVSQSQLLSFSQPDYVRSARASLAAARYALEDTRQRIVTDAALQYVELDSDKQQLASVGEEQQHGRRLVQIEEERVAAGMGTRLNVLNAQLRNEQLELRRLHLQDSADLLSVKLAHLTGLPQNSIDTETRSIPAIPDLPRDSALVAEAAPESYSLKSANSTALSRWYVAQGDSRQVDRPEIDFALQYARYAKFNNYAEYYLRFQHNNFSVGVQITLPFFDAARREKARGSAAAALRAQNEAYHLRDQLSEQTLEQRKNMAELATQQRIAELQSQIAQEQLRATETELQAGTGNPNSPPVTPRDAETAGIEERQRYVDLLDANLQLTQAKVHLLRALGQIVEWAQQKP